MLREKKCKHCNKYFTYDDGQIDLGLGTYEKTSKEEVVESRYGYCPLCDDPNYVYELSYKKESILWMFKKYLASKKIDVTGISEESIIDMMRAFPRTYATFTSNGTYRTITLFPGMKFHGEFGEFELGISFPHNPQDLGKSRIWYNRYIICVRCRTQVTVSAMKALFFYIGLSEKRCGKCDIQEYYPDKKRNTAGLRNGSDKSEYSDRALAKALNVSRMDYRRNKNKHTRPVSSLPVGSVVGCYEIIAAYWDENPSSYSPKYLVRCTDCKQEFRILQKKIASIEHYCALLKRVR